MDRKKTSEEIVLNGIKIKIIKDDITKQDTEVIVNAANSSLLGGGGVDGAIHRAGGPKILQECRKIHMKQGGCPTGKAVITTGGNLKAKYVIHTVGPIWHGGDKNESEFLRNCYINSLKLVREYNIQSISFPSISTGAYGYPIERACPVALNAIKEFSKTTQHNIKEIRFVLFTDSDFEVYKNNFEQIFIKQQ